MHALLCMTACVAAASGGFLAQGDPPAEGTSDVPEVAATPTTPPVTIPGSVAEAVGPPVLALTPAPAVEPVSPVHPAAVAMPPPAPVEAGIAPLMPDTPADRPPVLIGKENEGGGLVDALGGAAGGLAGGAAGAAVAGPVGKFAGGYLGRRLFKGLFGKDDAPQVTAVPQPPAATDAGRAAVDVVHDAER